MPSLDLNSPLHDAVRQMAGRVVTPSGMTSREWELVPAEVRLRSMFSSRVEYERTLAEMKVRLEAGIANVKRDGATMDKGRFVEEMRAIIREDGYKRPDGAKQKSVRNLRSRARLELIWNMNVAQARGYARWLADMDPHMLAASPCYELVRFKQRREIRDWPLEWADHGGKFYGAPGKDYPGAKGRMIAKKTDPIWRWISRFKTPWPPFDWGSGMGLVNVLRDESEALGVIGSEDPPQDPETLPYNATAEASLVGIPQERRQAIIDTLAGDVAITGDKLVIRPLAMPEGKFRLPAVPRELAAPQAKAVDALDAMPPAAKAKVIGAIAETTAAQRLVAFAKASGQELTEDDFLGRALMQFFAMTAGLNSAIRAMREEEVRDSVWSEMDFSGVFDAIFEWIGGDE